MTPVEIENCIESMIVLVDTRECPRAEGYEKRMEALGVPYERKKLDYGDYTYHFPLPNGKPAYEGDTVSGAAVIERKMSLDEFSGNLCQ